ncbi:hypothetical protein ABEY43_07155 [Priestia megaterium]
MIDLLNRIITNTEEDGTQISRLPNNQEVMDKINEIVKIVNLQERTINQLRSEHNSRFLNGSFKPKKML